ncbi:hypothetical protein [Streptomyces uncialis]|uniref:hypothetical protein n=1 Tax=Streptomyces uncialis TaxID=1048205 RepID=UPI002F945CCB|nr:hypothetical protein OG924_37155 [Streptomyces uncialis]
MSRTITLTHALDQSGLTSQARSVPAGQDVSPAADVSRYAHPNFLCSEPGAGGFTTFSFTAFTGREPEPQTPLAVYEDRALDREHLEAIRTQYRVARILWSKARLRDRAVPVLRTAAPLWEAWEAAHTTLTAVFREFWETPDNRWRSQLLRLGDAETAALDAARAWDAVAGQLAALAEEHASAVEYEHELALTTVASEIGIDASAWLIGAVNEYGDGVWVTDTPLARQAHTEIGVQRGRLRDVADLAGDREPV